MIIIFLVCYILVSYLQLILFLIMIRNIKTIWRGYDNTTILLWFKYFISYFSYIFMVYLNHIMYNNVFIQ